MEIWVHRNGQYAGRFSESAIRDKVADGSLSATDLAWDEAKAAWKPISDLLAAFPAATPNSAPVAVPDAATKPVTSESSSVSLRTTPPPLPSIAAVLPATPMPAAGPPPLPVMTSSGPGSTIPATTSTPAAAQAPEGETIWSPVIAILGSLFLSPAFGGFIIWRNWLIMKRRRRALMAAPWFWLGFIVVGLVFYSPNGVTLLIWIAYTLAWIAFSAFPQIRYVQTTFKRERTRWGLPLGAAVVLGLAGFIVFQVVRPSQKTTLEPSPEQPRTTQLSQSHDRIFTAEELRDIYKSSVLEVRTTWK